MKAKTDTNFWKFQVELLKLDELKQKGFIIEDIW